MSVIEFQALDVVIDVVKILGELHVVTEHDLEHVMAVARDRQLQALEIMRCQGENILQVVDIVERDAQVTHECPGTAQAADGPQYRK